VGLNVWHTLEVCHTSNNALKSVACRGGVPHFLYFNFSHGMKMLLSSYTKGLNKQLGLSGSLFTQNMNAKQVSSEFSPEDYVLNCFRYIHQNTFEVCHT
jgi:hypothetical protein